MASAVEKALGRRVAELRKAAKVTQANLAEAVGVGVETISRLERGSSIPPLDRLNKIANALGVGLQDLFKPTVGSKALVALIDQLRVRDDTEILLVGDLARRLLMHLDSERPRRK